MESSLVDELQQACGEFEDPLRNPEDVLKLAGLWAAWTLVNIMQHKAGPVSEDVLSRIKSLIADSHSKPFSGERVTPYFIKDEYSDEWPSSSLLLSGTMARQGHIQKAQQLIHLIEDRSTAAYGLYRISCVLAQARKTREAIEMLRASGEYASEYLYKLAVELSHEKDKYDEALALARAIEEPCVPYTRSGALWLIIAQFAQDGAVQHALEILPEIETASYRESALEDLVEAFAKSGQVDQAYKLSRQITEDRSLLEALPHLAGALFNSGQKECANAILAEIFDVLQRIPENQRMNWFCTIVRPLADTRCTEQVLLVFDRMKTHRDFASLGIGSIAEALHRVGRLDVLDAYLDTTTDTWQRTHAAAALFEIGEIEAGLRLLHERYPSNFILRLRVIAYFSRIGEFDEALERCRRITDPAEYRSTIALVAEDMVKHGQVERGINLVQGALSEIGWQFVSYAAGIELAKQGKLERALEIANQRPPEDFYNGRFYWDMAEQFAGHGHYAKAFSLLGLRGFYDFLQGMVSWSPILDGLESGLSRRICQQACNIFGWYDPHYAEFARILS